MPVVSVMFIWSQQTFDLIKRIYFLQPKEEIVQYTPGKKKKKQQFYTNILSNHNYGSRGTCS